MNSISIIMPVYNVEKYVYPAIDSVLKQTFPDFELLIIDDQSPDNSVAICQSFNDPRIRIIHQNNRGLAGARNTGIKMAKGNYIAFLDADDYWAEDKLEKHLNHLHNHPDIGISYCPSIFINDDGELLGIKQTPKLKNISVEDIFCRNPIGNGSAPVIRKQVFKEIEFSNPNEKNRKQYFDESFKQSEDIECWLRIASQTAWKFEGIAPALTYYRVNEQGLSANVVNQFNNWKRACNKLQMAAPDYVARFGSLAEAYQLRYLARRAIRSRNATMAIKLITLALKTNYQILIKEPARTINTLLCANLVLILPNSIFTAMENYAMQFIGLFNQVNRKVEAL